MALVTTDTNSNRRRHCALLLEVRVPSGRSTRRYPARSTGSGAEADDAGQPKLHALALETSDCIPGRLTACTVPVFPVAAGRASASRDPPTHCKPTAPTRRHPPGNPLAHQPRYLPRLPSTRLGPRCARPLLCSGVQSVCSSSSSLRTSQWPPGKTIQLPSSQNYDGSCWGSESER